MSGREKHSDRKTDAECIPGMPGGKALQNRGKKQNMSLDDEEGEIMWKPLYYTILYYVMFYYTIL